MAAAEKAAGEVAGLDFELIGKMTESGMKIIQGISHWATAGDIGRAKKRLLESRAKYNRKQIGDAFKQNYAAQMSQYAQQLSDLSLQKVQAESQILQQVIGNQGAVDIQGSSFKDLAFSTLKGEFNSELNRLIDNNINQNIHLANEAIIQEKQVNLGESLGKIEIDRETDNAKTKAIGQIISGATLGLNTFVEKQADEKSKNETQKNIWNWKSYLKNKPETQQVTDYKRRKITGGR